MLSKLHVLRPLWANAVSSKLVGTNINSLVHHHKNQVIAKRWSGHNAMDITPSNYGWKHFKDMFHFYTLLGTIPLFVVMAIINIRANPELIETPEGYEPRHWEYYKHPITRWMARYLYTPMELEHEMFLSLLETESESRILYTIDRKVKAAMQFYADHRSDYFRPLYAEYFRIGRDESMHGVLAGLANDNSYFDSAYDPQQKVVPVEGYIPSPPSDT